MQNSTKTKLNQRTQGLVHSFISIKEYKDLHVWRGGNSSTKNRGFGTNGVEETLAHWKGRAGIAWVQVGPICTSWVEVACSHGLRSNVHFEAKIQNNAMCHYLDGCCKIQRL